MKVASLILTAPVRVVGHPKEETKHVTSADVDIARVDGGFLVRHRSSSVGTFVPDANVVYALLEPEAPSPEPVPEPAEGKPKKSKATPKQGE